MSKVARPDVPKILGHLKDFQRRSADYVFRRFYRDSDPTNRFLLADEVGLGKTLVARGVIAQAVDHLWDDVKRIDILYICSNGDIARQNISKLRLPGHTESPLASRVTLLPLYLSGIAEKKVNFISFTPGTSFDLGSSGGIREERALLYWMLRDPLELHSTGFKNLMQGGVVSYESWRAYLDWFYEERFNDIDEELKAEFSAAVKADKRLVGTLEELVVKFRNPRERSTEERREQNQVVGDLRNKLARICVGKLEPDLIILDEFQRFRHLLKGEGEVGELAQQLFNYCDHSLLQGGVKVMLLSATPYKMYTLAQESETEDHYQDFLSTVSFLFHDEKRLEGFKGDLSNYRTEICGLGTGGGDTARSSVEANLQKVMCRTERLAVSEDRKGMLQECATRAWPVDAYDLHAFRSYDKVVRAAQAEDPLEYWKSTPYMLNLMDDYVVKRKVRAGIKNGDPDVIEAIRNAKGLISAKEMEKYQEVNWGNARMRALVRQTLDTGVWKLLWVPPSLPYYNPDGPLADSALQKFTKTLIFSSWQVVPKAVALLASYEAERRIINNAVVNNTVADSSRLPRYSTLRKDQGQLLKFSRDDGRLSGLASLCLFYPSAELAFRFAHLLPCGKGVGEGSLRPSRTEIFDDALGIASKLVASLPGSGETKGGDERWYWMAPILLDKAFHPEAGGWLSSREEDIDWRGMTSIREKGSLFSEYVDEVLSVFHGNTDLGPKPADLAEVLAKTALGSPAVAAMRGLLRLWPAGNKSPEIWASASKIAMGYRSLFNRPESILLVRSLFPGTSRYWEQVLDYGIEGNLQAVVDEYLHVLLGARFLQDPDPKESLNLAKEYHSAASLQAARMEYDEFVIDRKTEELIIEKRNARCRFALRFGDAKAEEEGDEDTREDQVRTAFNSPFQPFILASTSVGQEGLDFHLYCHSIYHWNLPSNPVDLEQREGRIHRFKGHVIRKNLAEKYGATVGQRAEDPWKELFEHAEKEREKGASDLVPFWVFEGSHKIERHVPLFPLSREVAHYKRLKRTLVLYRLAFGQPRQEDLVAFLEDQLLDLSPEEKERRIQDIKGCRIDLTPNP